MRITANILILLIAINMLLACGSPKNDAKSKTFSVSKIKTKSEKTHSKISVNKSAKTNKVAGDSTGRIYDTSYRDNKITRIDTINYITNSPKITPLPFGFDFNVNDINKAEKFYSSLIYKDSRKLITDGWTPKMLKEIKVYRLPSIKKIKYIQISYVDSNKCNDGRPFANYLKLTKYRYRLPDIKQFQCYYWCDYDYNNNKYPQQVKQNCEWCLLNFFYGYLILYNPKTEEASIIAIYYNSFRDSSIHCRSFYIDKNYNIHLIEYLQEGDEDKLKPSDLGNKTIVSIAKSGEIILKRMK